MTIKTSDDAATATETAEAQPKKLLLGKRVLRHFNVKSSVQTGAIIGDSVSGSSIRNRCFPPESDGVVYSG